MPAHADALSLLPVGYTVTQFVDEADDFVPRDAGILNSRPTAIFRECVTVTDAAGLDLDAHLCRARFRNLALGDLEVSSWLGNLHCFHGCYRCFCSCHGASFEFSTMRRKANNSIELTGFDLRVKYHPKVCSAPLMVPLSKSTAISENSSLPNGNSVPAPRHNSVHL
jgi:hypothetical protein